MRCNVTVINNQLGATRRDGKEGGEARRGGERGGAARTRAGTARGRHGSGAWREGEAGHVRGTPAMCGVESF